MRRGVLTSLREKHNEGKEPIKKRMVSKFLTEEEKFEKRKKQKKRNKKKANNKHGAKDLRTYRKKLLDNDILPLFGFARVPRKLVCEIRTAIKASGLSAAEWLEQCFRAWEGYKTLPYQKDKREGLIG